MTNLKKKVDAIATMLLAPNRDVLQKAKADLVDLMKSHKYEDSSNCADMYVMDLLADIGAPDNLGGYRYVSDAILAVLENPEAIKGVNKGLYSDIAVKYGVTVPNVERSIRHLVEVAFDRCDYDVISSLFGNTINPEKGKLTNVEFIARCENIVRMRMKYE